jgi:hypothetical protein
MLDAHANIAADNALIFGDVMRLFRGLLPALFSLFFVAHANAQISGAGTQIIIPDVASTVSFISQIIVKDESGTSHSLSFEFYEALTSDSPGKKICTSVPLTAFQTKTVTLAGQCPLGAGNHHGFVILTDTTGAKDNVFYAFTRVENPAANGFSVEGYPIGHIGGGDPDSEVAGVKRRTSTNPVIQTNCFVAALDGDIDYSISLDVAGSQTLPVVPETLHAGQMRRYLDIFAQAGAPNPDYDNVTVTFTKNNPAQWPNTLIAFCTVQDNTSFGADFRIAKTLDAADPSRFRLNCFAASFGASNDCTNTLQPSAPTVPDTTTKVRLLTRIYAPDTVNCKVVGPNAAQLKIALVRDFAPGGTLAGGTTNAFTYATGPRAAIGNGFHQTYFLDVSYNTGATTFPMPFGVQCKSGNGMMDPYLLGTV